MPSLKRDVGGGNKYLMTDCLRQKTDGNTLAHPPTHIIHKQLATFKAAA